MDTNARLVYNNDSGAHPVEAEQDLCSVGNEEAVLAGDALPLQRLQLLEHRVDVHNGA